jgi:GNAT superfamily N-acetyltransferase
MWTDGLRQRSGRDGIPVSWVGLDGEKPVGSVAMILADMSTHLDLSPWLSGLFVVPEARGRGYGTVLVRHCEAAAWALGVSRLYLYTTTALPLYAGLGWLPIGSEHYDNEDVTIMARDAPSGRLT